MNRIQQVNKPDFLLIGAQKCGTTWLWNMLKQHPGTDLRNPKEIEFFSSSTNYYKGLDWYYRNFQGLDSNKVLGEGTTDYFHDSVLIDNLQSDQRLPMIPELIKAELPQARIILILRDPVERAISAYYHHLEGRRYPPGTGIFTADEQHPRLRILKRGLYHKYLKVWKAIYPDDRFMCLIFEKDILGRSDSLSKVYEFLDLDKTFLPKKDRRSTRSRWGWTHIWLNYYLGSWYGFVYRQLRKTFFATVLSAVDRLNIIPPYQVPATDIERLEDYYKPVRSEVEDILGINLDEWKR